MISRTTNTPSPEALTPASPRELKRLIKDWRAGRATRNVLQAMSDAYVAVFGAVMIGAMVVNVILKAQRTIAQCTSATCLSARTILPWAAFAATSRSRWRPAGCSGRYWHRQPKGSGCSTRRSHEPNCSALGWSVAYWRHFWVALWSVGWSQP